MMTSVLFISHSQIESNMSLFLDVLSTHACLGSHQKLGQCTFLTGQQWNRGSIASSRTDGGSNRAIGSLWWLNSYLFLIEALKGLINLGPLKELYSFLEMLPYILLMKGFFFLFKWWVNLRTFLELQQSFIVLTDLLCHHYLLTFAFLLNLRQDILTRV